MGVGEISNVQLSCRESQQIDVGSYCGQDGYVGVRLSAADLRASNGKLSQLVEGMSPVVLGDVGSNVAGDPKKLPKGLRPQGEKPAGQPTKGKAKGSGRSTPTESDSSEARRGRGGVGSNVEMSMLPWIVGAGILAKAVVSSLKYSVNPAAALAALVGTPSENSCLSKVMFGVGPDSA